MSRAVRLQGEGGTALAPPQIDVDSQWLVVHRDAEPFGVAAVAERPTVDIDGDANVAHNPFPFVSVSQVQVRQWGGLSSPHGSGERPPGYSLPLLSRTIARATALARAASNRCRSAARMEVRA